MDGPGIEQTEKNGSYVTGQKETSIESGRSCPPKGALQKSLFHKSRDSEIISNHPSGYYKIII